MTGKHRRSFTRRRRVPWMGLCIAGTLAALASCAPQSENMTTVASDKQLRVDRVEFHHLVRFRGNDAVLSDSEVQGLNAFLARQATGQGVWARVSGGDTLLDVRRQAAIMSHLRKRGLAAGVDSGPPSVKLGPDAVQVTLVRHIVTLPNCGDWSQHASYNHDNAHSPDFGCATTANLGMMVADPSVLVRAPDIGPGDGQALAKGVENYREDKVKISKKVKEFMIKSDTNKTKSDKGN